MKLTFDEIAFLAAWAREEREPNCYQLPAHQMLLARKVPGGSLIDLIKAWTRTEKRRDLDILQASDLQQPAWPWSSMEQFRARLADAANEIGRNC